MYPLVAALSPHRLLPHAPATLKLINLFMGWSKAVKLLTYNDWKSAGFYVRKGERAMGYNSKGEALFDRKQVEEQDAFDRIHKLIWEENR